MSKRSRGTTLLGLSHGLRETRSMKQIADRHSVTHLGMPDFRSSVDDLDELLAFYNHAG